MKRLWLGLGILAALFGAGLGIMRYADASSATVCDYLEQAQRAVLASDTETAKAYTRQAQEEWEKAWSVWAAIGDHTVLDEIDVGFARIEIYGSSPCITEFAAQCGALARQVEALGEEHRLNWRNLL